MKKRHGLTVLETLIAMGLLSVALLSLLLVFTQGMRWLRQSSQVTGATDVAREFLERVRANGYDQVTPGTYDGRLAVPTAPDPTTGFPPGPYPQGVRNNERYTLVVRADSSGLPPNTVAVKVDVYWNDQAKISLETYLRP